MIKMHYVVLTFTLMLAITSKLWHTQTTLQDQNVIYYDALMGKENQLEASLAQI
jgi:hypothetical protein